jgi:starch-binding outer membrane protein, SusD/RagB family
MTPMRTFAVATILVVGTAACGNFLDGPSLGAHDPNASSRVPQPGPLYVALEASQSLQFESQIARTAAMYVQQVAGIARQQAGYDRYTIGSGDIDSYYTQVYAPLPQAGGSGISDARRIQILARSLNDSLYIGIGKVWEALIIGEAASVWGSVPYREALDPTGHPTPAYDPQLQVYADVETQLDSAINIFLAAAPSPTGPTNLGPTGSTRNDELIYPGRTPAQIAAVYTAVAHTLKARFFIHQGAKDASNYAKALAEALKGISSPADDWNWFHAVTPTSQNVWSQFQAARGDLGPGAALVNIMHRRITAGLDANSDRLNFYFVGKPGPACDAACTGFRPSADVNLPGGGGNSDFNNINLNPDFHQPEVTFAENELIAAEAAFQTGGQAAAQPFLNAVRGQEAYGATTVGPITFAAQASIPATLQNIMEEKYIDLFLNIESWRDYLRTCLPALAPAPQTATSAAPGPGPIPGRLPYGQTEIDTNPNVPKIGSTANNDDTPSSCPRLTYTSVPAGN